MQFRAEVLHEVAYTSKAVLARYNPLLIAISFVIAVLASYVALDFTERVTRSRGRARTFWWLGGAAAMGVGIWSMHFVGMLALELPVPMQYDVPLVLLSVLVAIAASALALHIGSRPALPAHVAVAASLLMGAAISGMHYIGMAAMRIPAAITWSAVLVVVSVLIAGMASFAAMTLAFRLRRDEGRLFGWMKLGAAAIMGIAVVGMHYTGMAAASFGPATGAPHHAGMALHGQGLSIAVIAGTLLILGLALASAAIDERELRLEREQRVRQDVEAASRLKDEFLATLSHELRTPLNVILGRTQMLRSIAHDGRVRELTDMIERNGAALAKLVEDLLDVSRITLGHVRLDPQPVRLADLLTISAQGVRPAAQAKDIRLTVSAADPGLVTGDQTRLQQIIWNLLTNAIKFTPAHGHVDASVWRDADQIRLVVCDSGRGIDPAFLPHVFEPFRQQEPSASRTHGGLGIGLSIVRHLVELHGGTVMAHSTGHDRGSLFTVILPAAHEAERTVAPASALRA
jgi:signal transduction histidine kinase